MNPRTLVLTVLLLGSCALTEQNAAIDDVRNNQSDQSPSTSGAADSTRPITDLAQARSRWKESGLSSYKFTQQRSCFCRREYTRAIAVVVQNDSIAAATYEDSGLPVSKGVRKTVRSIDGWLDYIATRQLNDPYEFEALFHPKHGYPIRYSVDQREGVADDTEEVIFSAFNALP